MKIKIYMKKFFASAFLFAIFALVPAFSQNVNAQIIDGDIPYSNLTWELDTTTGVIIISGNGAMPDFFWLSNAPWYNIPWHEYRNVVTTAIIEHGVTTIGEYAFRMNNLTSVSIPDSVTAIERSAFEQNNLTSVIIPNGVTIIERNVFRSNSLTSAIIPSSVTTIGGAAFANNNLTNVTIPGNVTEIGYMAFAENNLTSIIIPNSVIEIREYAFRINNLTSATIGSSVARIGNEAFRHNPDLTNVYFSSPAPPTVQSDAFRNIAPNARAIVPSNWGAHGITNGQLWNGLIIEFAGIPVDEWTVVFNPNNGTRIGGGLLSQTVQAGGSATAPILSRAGWVFNGWNGSFNNVTVNITVTARWLRLGAVASGGEGDVTSADILWLARHLAKHTGFEVLQNKRVANVRGEDRDPTANDITLLLKWLVGYDLESLILESLIS
ncbi:MAG: leucine-rich repeat protein [Defluviitaleaceae bacterium]|nr:leucine-rich repeat protein [Defluviitaleaceae bacterium]